jgi:uncharacterized protein (TIGR02996 family)
MAATSRPEREEFQPRKDLVRRRRDKDTTGRQGVTIEAGLLRAIHEEPGDWTNWLVLADWLDEHGFEARAAFLRLYVEMRRAAWGKTPAKKKNQMLSMLAAGVRPCLPSISNSLGMTFVLIPPGAFRMGSRRSEKDRFPDEDPIHEVELTRPFYLGVHPVTQGQYEKVMRRNPSAFREGGAFAEMVDGLDTADFPVEQVSWENATEFCRRLSARAAEKRAGRAYRLPTEAEWEYAARAGVSSQPFFLRNSLRAQDANSVVTGLERTCPVGSHPPNAFGLYGVCGNVWEWCSDWFDAEYYQRSPRQDPPGAAERDEADKVFRGGAWRSWSAICRAACRSADRPDFADDYLGFRAALSWTRELAVTGALP